MARGRCEGIRQGDQGARAEAEGEEEAVKGGLSISHIFYDNDDDDEYAQ